MGLDYNRGSLIFIVLGFQLHLVAMAITGDFFVLGCPNCDDLNDAIVALIIIAYLLYLVTFVLNMIMNFMGELKGNLGVNIACIVMCLFAALCCIISIAIYAINGEDDNDGRACAMTTFFTSGSCGIIAGVFLILLVCNK